MSPRNSGPAVCNMMENTSTHRIIADPSTAALISEVCEEFNGKNYAVEVLDVPGLFDAYPCLAPKSNGGAQPKRVPAEPYPAKEHVSQDETVILLHSSGSTGFPKPIPIRHDYLLNSAKSREYCSARYSAFLS